MHSCRLQYQVCRHLLLMVKPQLPKIGCPGVMCDVFSRWYWLRFLNCNSKPSSACHSCSVLNVSLPEPIPYKKTLAYLIPSSSPNRILEVPVSQVVAVSCHVRQSFSAVSRSSITQLSSPCCHLCQETEEAAGICSNVCDVALASA